MARLNPALLLSCEHAGNSVPARYQALFRAHRLRLASHEGLDLGALAAARSLRRLLGAPLLSARHSRLLVDLNRSRGHRALFSSITRALPAAERRRILERYWQPYRDQVRAALHALLADSGFVVHVSVHSFTPVLDGEVRDCAIGLLYDPGRPAETTICRAWRAALLERQPGLRVRRNYPYRGTADGLVTALRRELPAARYAGIELELNQRLLLKTGPAERKRLMRALATTLSSVLRDYGRSSSRGNRSGTLSSMKSRTRPRLT